MRAAACRALVAALPHRCVRAGLAATKDCLHNLVMTLTPMGDCKSTATELHRVYIVDVFLSLYNYSNLCTYMYTFNSKK